MITDGVNNAEQARLIHDRLVKAARERLGPSYVHDEGALCTMALSLACDALARIEVELATLRGDVTRSTETLYEMRRDENGDPGLWTFSPADAETLRASHPIFVAMFFARDWEHAKLILETIEGAS